MMSANIPDAILFDLDNTLTNRRASVNLFARQFYLDFRSRHQMVRVEDILPIIQNADGGGYRPLEERWSGLQRWIPWKGKPSAEELCEYWYRVLGRFAVETPYLHETLKQLKTHGVRLGIITNGPEGLQNETIDTLNVRHYMDYVIVSETVGVKKPDSAIYEMALSDLSLQPHQVWFVGDNPDTDILGAYQLGMTTVWIRGYHLWEDLAFEPNYTIDQLSDILTLLI